MYYKLHIVYFKYTRAVGLNEREERGEEHKQYIYKYLPDININYIHNILIVYLSDMFYAIHDT